MAGPRTPKKAEPEYVTAEQVAEVDDLGEDDVDVPEWGGKVRVKQLSQKQVTKIVEEIGAGPENGGRILDIPKFLRLLIREGCIKPSLSENQIEGLEEKAIQPTERIARAIADMSGIDLEFGIAGNP